MQHLQNVGHTTYSNTFSFHFCAFLIMNGVTVKWYTFPVYILHLMWKYVHLLLKGGLRPFDDSCHLPANKTKYRLYECKQRFISCLLCMIQLSTAMNWTQLFQGSARQFLRFRHLLSFSALMEIKLHFLVEAQHYNLLFISVCDLLNDSVSISDYTYCQTIGWFI